MIDKRLIAEAWEKGPGQLDGQQLTEPRIGDAACGRSVLPTMSGSVRVGGGSAGVRGSVHDRAAGEVDLAGGDGAGPVGCGEGGDVGDLVVGGQVAGEQARGARRVCRLGLAGPVPACGWLCSPDPGEPGESSQLTRTPCGPNSAASWRHSPASAAQATWEPPRCGIASRPPAMTRMTPWPRRVMCRPTAVAMLKCAVTAFVTGRRKSSNRMAIRGVPWTSSLEVALKQMSMLLRAATALACPATVARSRTSTCATSAVPPSRRMRWAMSSPSSTSYMRVPAQSEVQAITTQVAVCRPAATRGFTPPVWLVSGLAVLQRQGADDDVAHLVPVKRR